MNLFVILLRQKKITHSELSTTMSLERANKWCLMPNCTIVRMS